MKSLLLAASLLLYTLAFSQEPHLQVIKNGKVRKRVPEGTYIRLIDRSGNVYIGPYNIINDSILLIGPVQVNINDMRQLRLYRKKDKKPFNWEQFGYSTLGVALSTAGMSLSKWEPLGRAAIYSAVLGYSQYALGALKKVSLKKRRFRSNKRIRLRIWTIDNYGPARRPLAPF
jgi:hypothetical protein